MGFEIGRLTLLALGYVGESGTRVIRIDMKDWLKRWPDAAIVVQAARPDGYKYIPATEMEDGELLWQVERGELTTDGKGFAQICAVSLSTGKEYKSRVVQTVVAQSLEGFNDLLLAEDDPAQKWVNKVLVAAEEAKTAEATATEAAGRAENVSHGVENTVANAAQQVLTTAAPAHHEERKGDVLVVNNSANTVMHGLRLYGKTSDDMTAVGDVTIKATGKNVLNPAEAVRTHATAVVTVDGDKVHVTTDGTNTYSGAKIAGFHLLAGVTYTLTATVEAVIGSPRICFRKVSGASMITSKSGTGKLALKYTPDEDVLARVDLLACEGTAMAGDVTFADVQLEVGKEATVYEPYKGGGSVTIATGGLHGILVADGGNYRNDAGAQYVADCLDFVSGQRVQHIGVIDSYAWEDVGDVWKSSTGDLSAGAVVAYALPEPIVTPLEDDLLAAHASLTMQSPITTITTDSDVEMAVSYVTTGKHREDGWYIAPVQEAWQQRMLDRIDQCLIPTTALRDVHKAASGYTNKGRVLTGINYSSVHQEERGKRMVGIQVPLSTYYSAMENPASKMYTEDLYQDDSAASSYYGIVCSGFVSYVLGSKTYIWTQKMADLVANGTWSIVPIESENDLFRVRRGDVVVNTVVSSGSGDHCRIVRDVVHDSKTGRLIGFNLSESWKPYCRTVYYDLSAFLAQLREEQPYRVVRVDDIHGSNYTLDVVPIAYSKTVYPDKGDGGVYAEDEEIYVYLPHASKAQSLIVDGVAYGLDALEIDYINGVKVYRLPALGEGVHQIWTDNATEDPAMVTVGEVVVPDVPDEPDSADA